MGEGELGRQAGIEEAVEELAGLLEELDPDPVDVFEDRLAAEGGLVRHPRCGLGRWREVRVKGETVPVGGLG